MAKVLVSKVDQLEKTFIISLGELVDGTAYVAIDLIDGAALSEALPEIETSVKTPDFVLFLMENGGMYDPEAVAKSGHTFTTVAEFDVDSQELDGVVAAVAESVSKA